MECPRQLDPRLMGDCPIDRTLHMEDDRVLHQGGEAILLQRGRLVQGVRHHGGMTVPIPITVVPRRCL